MKTTYIVTRVANGFIMVDIDTKNTLVFPECKDIAEDLCNGIFLRMKPEDKIVFTAEKIVDGTED